MHDLYPCCKPRYFVREATERPLYDIRVLSRGVPAQELTHDTVHLKLTALSITA